MRLKIGIICYPSVGGSGVVATELGKLLAERHHEIHFIASSMPFRLKKVYPNIYFHEVAVNQYSVFQYPPYDLALASKIAEVAEREQLDVLHAHYAIPHAVCAILAKQMLSRPIQIVTTLHGTDITVLGQDSSLIDLIRFGIEKSDAVTAVSQSLATQTKELIAPKTNIETIYNFIDRSVYYRHDVAHLREEYGIEPHEKVVLHISNFRPVKRVSDIIRTFARIQENVPAKLMLIGDGPEMSTVCSLVRELNLRDRVLMLGKQDNIEQLMSIADVKLLMSEKESFGLVLLEAMACGIPCIGTNRGGIPEVIRHGETGYIVELGDDERAAEYAVELLTNEQLYEQMSQAALEDVRLRFDAPSIVDQYESLYRRVITEGVATHGTVS